MKQRVYRGSLLALTLTVLAASALLADDHSAPMEVRNGMPFVQVMVNGQGPFTFGIDTGTGGQALVSPS